MIRAAALAALLFLPPLAHAEDPPAFRFEKGDSALGIPFELNSNKVYLPVRIDGGEPRWFVLDSGCPVTAIDLALARALKLPVENLQPLAGAGEGRTDRGDTKVRSLTLPGLELRPERA
jgi:Aspartyl protease